MTDALKLPPLPEPLECISIAPGTIVIEGDEAYSAEQMQAYVLADRAQRQVSDAERLDAARDAALEEAAAICDDRHHGWRWDNEPDSDSGPRDCAKRIRAAIRSQQAQASMKGGDRG